MTTTAAANSLILDTIDGHRDDRGKRHDQGMRGDLEHVVGAIRWAWDAAWDIPAQQRADEDRGASTGNANHVELSPSGAVIVEPRDPCKVPGEKFDIGLGDHRARRAIQLAGPRLTKCEIALDIACILADKGAGPRQLPVIQLLDENANARQLNQVTNHIRWRLDYLADHATTMSRTNAHHALKELVRADRALLAARGPFDRAQRAASRDASINDPDKVCSNCKVRNKLSDRKLCATCNTYKQRNKGKDRPADLDAA